MQFPFLHSDESTHPAASRLPEGPPLASLATGTVDAAVSTLRSHPDGLTDLEVERRRAEGGGT